MDHSSLPHVRSETMIPDIIIAVRFFLPEEGGRKTPIRGEFYSCPLFLGEEGFDCRLILNNR